MGGRPRRYWPPDDGHRLHDSTRRRCDPATPAAGTPFTHLCALVGFSCHGGGAPRGVLPRESASIPPHSGLQAVVHSRPLLTPRSTRSVRGLAGGVCLPSPAFLPARDRR